MMRSYTPHTKYETSVKAGEIRLLAEACSTGPQRLAHPLFLSFQSYHAILNLIVPVAQLDRAAAF